MSTGIDYAQWWIQLDDRRKELQGELAEVTRLMDVLRPLADRIGGVPEREHVVPQSQPMLVRESGVPHNTPPEGTGEPGPEREGIYANMSSLEAALHYMREVGGVRTTPEIADALIEGGFKTNSPNFKVNMYTTMKRLAERGDVAQLKEGKWRLTFLGELPSMDIAEADDEAVDDADQDQPHLLP